MKTILFARLRTVDHYKNEPLNHILDSYYYLLERWIIQHDYDYRFFNLTIGAKKKKRNFQDWKDSDVIIIPSEQEFRWNPPYLVNPKMGMHLRTFKWLDEIKKQLNDGKKRKVIILSSDKLDTIELYKSIFNLPNLEYHLIDENEFPLGVHSLKYNFIKDVVEDKYKAIDFSYWGSKKNDGRHEVIKEIKKQIPNHELFGYRNFTSSYKWLSMKDLLFYLPQSKYTLCFNTTPYGFTSRYNEALACKIIPFVWKDYDIENKIVSDEFLRVQSVDEMIGKMKKIEHRREEYVMELIQEYEERRTSPQVMYNIFLNKLNEYL